MLQQFSVLLQDSVSLCAPDFSHNEMPLYEAGPFTTFLLVLHCIRTAYFSVSIVERLKTLHKYCSFLVVELKSRGDYRNYKHVTCLLV